jgi:hypothetical protein
MRAPIRRPRHYGVMFMRICRLVRFALAIHYASAVWGTADELPRGVPRTVLPDGRIYVDTRFSTRDYQQEAFKLVLQEANKVAAELNLPEKLPIMETNVTHAYIVPFGYALTTKSIGNITTENYWYNVREGNRFSHLTIADYDSTCLQYQKKHKLPARQMDTNAAYVMATQCLARLSMDVNGLNRDCVAHVALSPSWNDLDKLGDKPRGPTFVPIYFVWWTSAINRTDGYGCVASVELYLPTKSLIALGVDDPKYILRKPLVFANLAALFPQTNAPVTVITNWPPAKEMNSPSDNTSPTAEPSPSTAVARKKK